MEATNSIPEELTPDVIKAHLAGFTKTLSSSGVNLRVCAVKHYFKHVCPRPDLVVSIPNQRVARYTQVVLTGQELETLFSACHTMRELAVLHLLFDTGIRVREACMIELTDFEKSNQSLTIRHGKGDKLRVLPYSAALRDTLARYFGTLGARPEKFLFEAVAEPGTALTPRGIQYIVREVVKRSRLKKDIHPHTFRHSFAVHYINNGGNILRLKGLLGHGHIETTLHYLKFCTHPLTDVPTPLQRFVDRKKGQ